MAVDAQAADSAIGKDIQAHVGKALLRVGDHLAGVVVLTIRTQALLVDDWQPLGALVRLQLARLQTCLLYTSDAADE